MYLVGNFSMRDYFDSELKFQSEIKREDLIKAKNDSDYQIIDIINKKYYDADNNEWKTIKSI